MGIKTGVDKKKYTKKRRSMGGNEQQRFAIILILLIVLLINYRDTHKLFAETPRTWMQYGQHTFYTASALLFAALIAAGGKKAIAKKAMAGQERNSRMGREGASIKTPRPSIISKISEYASSGVKPGKPETFTSEEAMDNYTKTLSPLATTYEDEDGIIRYRK